MTSMRQAIDVCDFLIDAPEHVLIKMRDDFPNYAFGQDMDIICRDSEVFVLHLLRCYKEDARISRKGGGHIHFDCLTRGKIELRFDLYENFISGFFSQTVLRFKEPKWCTFVPVKGDDNLIKCYEFVKNKKKKYRDYVKYKHILETLL